MRKSLLSYILPLSMLLALAVPAHSAEMKDYCVVPPYVKRDLKPNILMVMDNAMRLGKAAYQSDYSTEPEKFDLNSGSALQNTSGLEFYNGATTDAPGLFNQNIWYRYETNRGFVPDPNGIFEGNLLNWVTTSMYDIIEAIIVGGTSRSRQTNVNTLVAYNDGFDSDKIFIYEDTTGKFNVCQFSVAGDLIISDSKAWLDIDPSFTCGLIEPGGKRPAPAYTRIALLEGGEAVSYASASSVPGHELRETIESTMGRKEFMRRLAGEGPAQPPAEARTAAMASAGSRSGAPVRQAAYSFLNGLFDMAAREAVAAAPLRIVTPASNKPAMPGAQLFTSYKYTPTATGGTEPYTWSTTSVLPAGLMMAPATGMITGVPSNAGDVDKTFNIVFILNDSAGGTDTVTGTLAVTGAPPLTITQPLPYTPGSAMANTTLHDGWWGRPYAGYRPLATGGFREDYQWSATGLPEGMTISSNGYISGTPVPPNTLQEQQEYFPVLTLTDGYDTTEVNTYIRIHGVALTIKPAPIAPATTLTLPAAVMGQEYEGFQFTAIGGTGDYTWGVGTATALPDGLSIDPNTGYISGQPKNQPAVNKAVAIWVYDGEQYQNLTVYINVVYSADADVKITWPIPKYNPGALLYMGEVKQGEIYPLPDGWRRAFAKGGDKYSYKWSSGGLYPLSRLGLAIDESSGVIYTPPAGDPLCPGGCPGFANSPTPMEAAQFPATLSVTDGGTPADIAVNIYMGPYTQANPDMWYPREPVTWPYYGMPDGYVYREYGGAGASIHYGSGKQTCSVSDYPDPVAGWITTFPPGLKLNPVNCTVSGVPTSAGSYIFQFTAKDEVSGISQTREAILLRIYDNLSPLAIVTPVDNPLTPLVNEAYLKDAYITLYYSIAPTAGGGAKPYTWSISSGSLPPGLSMKDPSTGIINGIPTTPGSAYAFELTVKDAAGHTDRTSVKMDVGMGPAAVFLNIEDDKYLPAATEGEPYTGFTFVGAYGTTGNYLFKISGSAPAGMGLDPDTGLFAGTPPVGSASTYYFQVCVRDADNLSRVPSCSFVYFVINAAEVSVKFERYPLQICASSSTKDPYTYNCTYNPGNEAFKHGLLQDYWDQANFGFLDFGKLTMDPAIEMCIPPNNQENFFTAVENAAPTDGVNKLVNAEHLGITLFIDAGAAKASCQDVFEDDTSPCRNNFILLLTNGEGADNPPTPAYTETPDLFNVSDLDQCRNLNYALSRNACFGWAKDHRPDKPGTQKVGTYVVNAMGINQDILGEAADAAGGLAYYATNPRQIKDKLEQALKDIIKKATAGTAASVLASGDGAGANIIQAIYYPRKRFRDSQNKTWDEIMWVGKLSAFWYWTDPYFKFSDIREETVIDVPPLLDLTQDLIIQPFYNATTETVQAGRFADADGNGRPDGDVDGNIAPLDIIEFEDVNSIWEAGKLLWERDLAADPRRIFVNLDDTVGMTEFNASTVASTALLREYMQTPDVANAVAIANFVMGYDMPGMRSRSVRYDLDGDGETLSAGENVRHVWKLGDILDSSPVITAAKVPQNLYHVDYCDSTYYDFVYSPDSTAYTHRGMAYAGGNDGMLHAFKLGYLEQMLGTTVAALHTGYDNTDNFGDEPLGYEKWAFMPKNVLPYLKYTTGDDYCHLYLVDQTVTVVDVSLCESTYDPDAADPSTTWNTDPVSTCASDPAGPKERDSWRTVLIGGMRFGGACKPANFVCDSSNTIDLDGNGVVDDDDCVKAPLQVGGQDIGMSAIFALDITDEDNPQLLWEYTHPSLGFTTSGPSIIRFNVPAGELEKLGQWYAVFGSGPTGPIDKRYEQFLGTSDQTAKLFVMDIKTGTPVRIIDTGIPDSFVMTMGKVMADFTPYAHVGKQCYGDTIETDSNYATDAMYIGFIKKCDGSNLDTGEECPVQTWRNGGIIRVLTGEDPNPANWNVSTMIDNIGPVYAGTTKVWDKAYNEVVVYAGTGRYFYERVEPWTGFINTVPDDLEPKRHLMGIVDPCGTGYPDGSPYGHNSDALGCNASISFNSIDDATTSPTQDAAGVSWRIEWPGHEFYTDPKTGITREFGAMRIITTLKTSVANEMLLFTVFRPYADECSLGGETHFGSIHLRGARPLKNIKGVAIMQVSTGNIKKIDLSSDFTFQHDGLQEGLLTEGEVGVTSIDPPEVSSQKQGIKKLLHIFERGQ